MRKLLDKGLQNLNTGMLDMGEMCEKAITLADRALREGDKEAGEACVGMQEEIREKEKMIETMCVRLLLLQQPLAQDLTNVSAALKMITDISRIGEISSDMAEVVLAMKDKKDTDTLKQMAKKTGEMVKEAIKAFVNEDNEEACRIIKADDEVDALFIQVREEIVRIIREAPTEAEDAVNLVMIAKYYEKIGDHAVNIAKWVSYMCTAEIPVV